MVQTIYLWYKWKMPKSNKKNMHSNIKSRITTPEGTSAFLPCCKGVRQGENSLPILLSLFLNDLEHYLMINSVNGLVCEANTQNTYSFIKVFILLFADDTVLFANNKEDLQNMLTTFEQYCEDWKLTVDVSKTKIIMLTCPCVLYPLTPHFYIVKVGFTGVYIIFLFLL